MRLEFQGEIFYWRGPAPYLFVAVPDGPTREIRAIASAVTYGWGVIPVTAHIGKTAFKTSLFPKEGRYLVPIKKSVQLAERVDVGDTVTILLNVGRDQDA